MHRQKRYCEEPGTGVLDSPAALTCCQRCCPLPRQQNRAWLLPERFDRVRGTFCRFGYKAVWVFGVTTYVTSMACFRRGACNGKELRAPSTVRTTVSASIEMLNRVPASVAQGGGECGRSKPRTPMLGPAALTLKPGELQGSSYC